MKTTGSGYEDAEKAAKLVKEAKALVEKYEKEGIPIPTAPASAVGAGAKEKSSSVAKEQADQRLKEELQKSDVLKHKMCAVEVE